MIAKGKAIAHGANAIGYAMREGKMGSLVGTNLLDSRQPGEIIKEFEMVNGNHERCKNKYLRFEIGIASGDEKRMSGEMLRAVTREFAAKMGLKNHQWIACTHKDTKHLHIHLIANRIGIDGKVYDTTFLGNRSARVAEEISRQLGLTVANDVRREKEYVRRNTDPKRQAVKEKLRRIAYGTLAKEHDNLKNFMDALMRQGVIIEPVENRKGKMYGLRFRYQGQTFKASEIGKEFGLRSLLNQFGITAPGQKGVSKVMRYSERLSAEHGQQPGIGRIAETLLAPTPWNGYNPDDEGAPEDMNLKKKKKKHGFKL